MQVCGLPDHGFLSMGTVLMILCLIDQVDIVKSITVLCETQPAT